MHRSLVGAQLRAQLRSRSNLSLSVGWAQLGACALVPEAAARRRGGGARGGCRQGCSLLQAAWQRDGARPTIPTQAPSVFSKSCRPCNFMLIQEGTGEGRPGPSHLLNVLFKVATSEGRLGYLQSWYCHTSKRTSLVVPGTASTACVCGDFRQAVKCRGQVCSAQGLSAVLLRVG